MRSVKLKCGLLSPLLPYLFTMAMSGTAAATTGILQKERDKLALIIAISQYAPETGWTSTSAANDVPLIRAALRAQGFRNNNISVLQDEAADKEGMTSAIRQLTEKATEGSTVVIHFSGHGQQVTDLNGDEMDGYDEALVPYDAPLKNIGAFKDYRGEKHLLDDELDALTYRLRQKLSKQGDLLLLLDACHSGTATRGKKSKGVRGTDLKIVFDNVQSTSNAEETYSWYTDTDEDVLAPMVVYSGSGANELNYEARDAQGKRVGSLSYAFSRALAEVSKQTTYQGLFDLVRQEMYKQASRQTPRIEGHTFRQLLGGKAVPRPEYFTVSALLGAQRLRISAGELAGLLEGSRLALYDIDVRDTSALQPKARARVVHSYLAESDIQLDRPLTEQEARNSWVFVEERSLGKLEVTCLLDMADFPNLKNKLQSELADAPGIRVVPDDAELRVSVSGDGRHLLLQTDRDRYVLMKAPYHEADTDEQLLLTNKLRERTLGYLRGKYIRKLQMNDPDFKVDFEIVPVNSAGQPVRMIGLPAPPPEVTTPSLVLKDGDYFRFSVFNRGSKDAYFTIIDIQPDNQVNLLIPYGRRTAEEFMIKAGETLYLNDIFVIGEPYGRECFKLIATPEPLNLSGVTTNRGENTNTQPDHPLEILFQSTYQTRGGRPVATAPQQTHISTLYFTISP